MGVNSLPKTVTRQRRGCDLNPGPSAPESSTLTTRLLSHPLQCRQRKRVSYKPTGKPPGLDTVSTKPYERLCQQYYLAGHPAAVCIYDD